MLFRSGTKMAVYQLLALTTHSNLWWFEVDVVDSAAWEVEPAGGESLLDGLERHVQVDDRVHTVDTVQSLSLRHRTRETWRG